MSEHEVETSKQLNETYGLLLNGLHKQISVTSTSYIACVDHIVNDPEQTDNRQQISSNTPSTNRFSIGYSPQTDLCLDTTIFTALYICSNAHLQEISLFTVNSIY